MSDYLAQPDFDRFLAELNNPENATDMGFTDLLGPLGYDFDPVGADDGLGPAYDLDSLPHLACHTLHEDWITPPMDTSLAGILEDRQSDQSPTSDPSASVQSEYTCEECGKCFSDSGSLDFHYRRLQHCPCRISGCQERFRSVSARDRHEQRSHVEGHARIQLAHDFTCADCMKEFSSNYELQNHANSAQHSPFACTCGKKFARRDLLARHIDTFGDDLPKYPCPYCKRHRGQDGFRRKDHLTQHILGYHKFEAEGTIENVQPSRRGKYRAPPVCPHRECSFYRDDSFKDLSLEEQRRTKPFETQSAYTKHMKTVHDYTPFPCTIVGCSKTGAKGYAREKDLINHRKKEHPEAIVYAPQARDLRIICPHPGCGIKLEQGSMNYHLFSKHREAWRSMLH